MELTALFSEDTRVLELGASSPRLAEALAAAGFRRYLGLVEPGSLEDVRRRSPGREDRLHPLAGPEVAQRCSTDVLVLREPYVRLAWAVRDLSARYVAVEVTPGARAELRAARLAARLTGDATDLGRHRCGGADFDVVELTTPPRPRTRCYLSEVVGVAGLPRLLDDAGVHYAVLRWFEALPDLAPGEDLDMLVADDDLETFRAVLAREPGTIPVDLYSESGLPGSDFRGVAYYPPDLARGLLDRATVHASGYRVPAPGDHLASLAYHAAYHKGERSGLPSRLTATAADPEHDYVSALGRVAAAQHVDLDLTLEGVDAHLQRVGWKPSPDTLRRLAEDNAWLRRRLRHGSASPESGGEEIGSHEHGAHETGGHDHGRHENAAEAELPELAVFFVRERAESVLGTADVLSVLAGLEFEVLAADALDPAARARCTRAVRGGNWGRGPFAVSGGEPVRAVVALHYGPRPPDPVVAARYPRLTNSDVLLAKNVLRDHVLAAVGEREAFNPVHSSDDEDEAWEYLAAALPHRLEELAAVVRGRKDAYRTTVPVVSVLSRGRRAKVELVDNGGGQEVRKTFGAHAVRHLEREVRALRELGAHVPAVPRLLATGENWFSLPYYRNVLRIPDRPDGSLVPLRHARQMVEVLRQVHARGADLIDAKPQNFLLDPEHGLKVVDLEFYHRYDGEPPEFPSIYAFAGVPEDFDGDVPYGEISYAARWYPFVGLSLDALLEDPVWLQHGRRTLYRLRWVAGTPRRVARSAVDEGLGLARRTRRFLGRHQRQWARRRALVLVRAGTTRQQQLDIAGPGVRTEGIKA
ncbi:hypothetical protein ATJ97_1335 [Georgenia soli]|uniref:Uncharacterized protein n=1 Tax=Georgenia soli TaxID=638953 RepID=A0A2A9EIE3_9MICO|nr:hypothetical protein [Georgenia soli]PFG38847.1 hypothetical protein ATJ97_1335 [Georgenia soli]